MKHAITTDNPEERVASLMETVRFLYPDEQYPHDETTVRAMIVQGGTDAQIRESIAIAAINMRVGREDKTRYAAGVLRNLMHPQPEPYVDETYPDDSEDASPFPEETARFQPRRKRRWFDREQAEAEAENATWD